MGETPYDEGIARVYDLLVHGRPDDEAEGVELEFLQWALEDVCPRDVQDILDVGCGTGRHVVPLARLGYRVTGMDSSPAMVGECRRKLTQQGLSADLRAVGLQELGESTAFDATICMDSVICYLQDTECIANALGALHDALRPGGILVLDNRNFLAQWPRYGVPFSDERRSGDLRIEYEDVHWLDDYAALYHVELDATLVQGSRACKLHNEDVLRVMTVGETVVYLRDAGFTGISSYPDFDRELWSEPCGERMIFLALRADD